ncbi:glycosyltransferase [Pedobacter miscanthi]|uniref:Glycosyltransferase 2-like domain-containing protein n=1 Tax=Pedobacter miscanthi TaxID=2259170 RepID=A0A366L1T6_9SPHI|nr:glycosyltransferase [Pedobacter miscanthi]RBQ07845.1 hypothetical protein DRW42_09580 [Pedobacter miscanthi]
MKNNRPRISIVMPCYNAAKHIAQSIQSILDQTLTDFELIIIDDGSNDKTEIVIRSFKDVRIKYHKLGLNQGNYSARNIGMKLARGKYIAMLDADDIAKIDRLEIQFNFLEKHKSIGCLGGLSEVIDDNGELIGKIDRPLSYKEIKVSFLKDNYLTQSTLMFRSTLIKKHNLRYNERYMYAGDYDFVARMIQLFKVVNLDKVLVQYRIHPSQISSAKKREQQRFAKEIRGRQLDIFQIRYTKKDLKLYLSVISEQILTREKIDSAIVWFNKLLNANEIVCAFDKKLLFNSFNQLLIRVIYLHKNDVKQNNFKAILGNNAKITANIINLKKRTERLNNVLKQFEGKEEFDVKIYNAIEHSVGAYGLWQSIRDIIIKASDANKEFVLICEDDLEFTAHYNKHLLYDCIKVASINGADILCGGVSGGFKLPKILTKHLIKLDGYWCNHFIIVFRPFFQKIIKHDFDLRSKVDLTMSTLTNNILVINPFIAVQKSFGYSDVTLYNNQNEDWVNNRFKSVEKSLERFLQKGFF